MAFYKYETCTNGEERKRGIEGFMIWRNSNGTQEDSIVFNSNFLRERTVEQWEEVEKSPLSAEQLYLYEKLDEPIRLYASSLIPPSVKMEGGIKLRGKQLNIERRVVPDSSSGENENKTMNSLFADFDGDETVVWNKGNISELHDLPDLVDVETESIPVLERVKLSNDELAPIIGDFLEKDDEKILSCNEYGDIYALD